MGKDNICNKIQYGEKEYINLCDLHTHTIFSFHGISSPTEMIEKAIECKYKMFGITDHYYDYDVPSSSPLIKNVKTKDVTTDMLLAANQQARIRKIGRAVSQSTILSESIQIISGYEYNLFQDPKFVKDDLPSLRIIGLHNWYAPEDGYPISIYKLLYEVDSKLQTGMYNIFAHPSRTVISVMHIPMAAYTTNKAVNYIGMQMNQYLHDVVDLCKFYGVAVEINAGDINDTRYLPMLIKICKAANTDIIVNSDSHSKYDLGYHRMQPVFNLLNDHNYNPDHIINFDEGKIFDLLRRPVVN